MTPERLLPLSLGLGPVLLAALLPLGGACSSSTSSDTPTASSDAGAGQAGAAGASGSGGSGTPGGAAGAAGNPSSAGAAGNPSSGGATEIERVDFTKAPAFTPDEAARICVTLAACLPLEFPETFGPMNRCIAPVGGVLSAATPGRFTTPRIESSAFDGPLVEGYRCLLAAGVDCAKAKACLTPDGPAGTCTPTAKGLDDLQCDGTRVKGCTLDGLPVVIDCARFDAVCPAGNSWCRFPDCPGATSEKCVGDDIYSCRTSGLAILDKRCTESAQKCGLPPDAGDLSCLGGVPCDGATAKPHCEGAVYVSCSQGADGKFVEKRRDCGARTVERRCTPTDDCVDTGTECTRDTVATCAGSKLTVCEDGFTKTLDCVTLGFSSCSTNRCVK